ncbi:MAG: P-II family nitrogen regulator [bacterium]|jgi:nitrogen regulatory protein P-II 1|nr:P-II family nitrogen regulator [bacterium]MDD5354761.1 P-II family nitrogen regulator [bacterium]MDD5756226.1 P-II family nitrogen regulator [bacterium]
MKKIEAVIRPEKVGEVRKALSEVGYPGLMISNIEGHGTHKGKEQQWRGETMKVDFVPKVKLEIIARDADVDKITDAIIKFAKTGEIGDGKIFIYPIVDAIRIRTSEKGVEAL